jgi:hypothetical protein
MTPLAFIVQLFHNSGINMTALLATCTKEKQWAVIQLSWAEVVRM